MDSTESPALPSLKVADLDATKPHTLELFCLSFLALFLELMVIRCAPAVVRMIAYYANLILISSFLGLGVGAIVAKRKKSLFGWFPALLLINVVWLLVAHFVTMPATASESRFYTRLLSLCVTFAWSVSSPRMQLCSCRWGSESGRCLKASRLCWLTPGTSEAVLQERCASAFSR